MLMDPIRISITLLRMAYNSIHILCNFPTNLWNIYGNYCTSPIITKNTLFDRNKIKYFKIFHEQNKLKKLLRLTIRV